MNPLDQARDCFLKALDHQNAGRLAEAEALYRQAHALLPERESVLANLAAVLLLQGKHAAAREVCDKALALAPDNPAMLLNRAVCARDLEGPAAALPLLDRAIAVRPDYAEAHNNRAGVLAALGRRADAIAAWRRAVELRPDYVQAWRNLGDALAAGGDVANAVGCFEKALALDDTPEARRALAGFLASPACDDAALPPALFARALDEAWMRPSELSWAAIRQLKRQPAVAPSIERAVGAWPRTLEALELFGPAGAAGLARTPLLLAVLTAAPACDHGFERFLTLARRCLLATAGATDPAALPFWCALARQCHINEYVMATEAAEMAQAAARRDELAAALAGGAPVAATLLVAVGAYFPLAGIAGAEALLQRDWPAPVAALLRQQLAEPAVERELRAAMPRLTEIAAGVSQLVRDQYEANPYPRWVALPAAGMPVALDALLRTRFPQAPLQALPAGDGLDVLVAGCGTGQHAIETAQFYAGARVLAVDLSLASLGYAQRKAREMGIANLDFAQADILQLGSVARRFDLIESVGVLHHLADPLAGWRQLLGLLRPGGLMRLGFYSEIARRNLVAARAWIAENGIGSEAASIRRCRQELLAVDGGRRFSGAMSFTDFFATSDCRDLLFHVQEHRLTLPQLAAMLRELGLVFIGFNLDAAVLDAYRARFPEDPAAIDLERWDRFETENPDTFACMYNFFVQRPA